MVEEHIVLKYEMPFAYFGINARYISAGPFREFERLAMISSNKIVWLE